MADDTEQDGQEPNLELPSLFGRKKKKQKQPEQAAPAAEQPEPDDSAEETTRRLPPVPPPSASVPPVEPAPEPAPVPVPDPVQPPEPVQPPVPEPPAPEPVQPPEPIHPPEPVPAPEPVRPSPVPQPVPQPVPEPVPEPAPQPDPVQAARAAFESPEETSILPQASSAPPAEPVAAAKPPKPPKVKRERKPVVLPRINPYVAAILAGVVSGLVAVVLSVGAQHGCESVRGVGSCGGLGLVALLVILAIEVFVGAVILKAFQVRDATSTSFLGVGIVAVLALVFFLGSLESAWMFLVLPVLTALTFAASYWVTASLVEVPKDEDISSSVT